MAQGKSKGKILQFPLTPEKYIKTKARSLSIRECLVNNDWQQQGMAHLVVARNQPSGNITLGIFLVDLLCLGLKEVIYQFNIPEFEYLDLRKEFFKTLDGEPCSYELAHNIIYGALEYAHDLGFKPHRDWGIAQYLLAEDDDDVELMDLQFGNEDGRPVVVVNPEDSMRSVIAQLNRVIGPGNFDIITEEDEEEPFSGHHDGEDGDEPEEEILPQELIHGKLIDHLYALSIYGKEVQVSPQVQGIRLKDYHFIDVLPEVGVHKFSDSEKDVMEKMFDLVNTNPLGAIPRLEDLIKKHPHNMVFQNYLTKAYADTLQEAKATRIIEDCYRNFPLYLFARVNYAHQLLESGRTGEVPSVFGGIYDLRNLYPEREGFHPVEFINFYTLMIRYFTAIGELQNADHLMSMLNELYFSFEDEKILLSRLIITDAKRAVVLGKDEDELLDALQAFKPVFKNEKVRHFYEDDFPLDTDFLRELKEIPHEMLISDLRQGIICSLRAAYLIVDLGHYDEDDSEVDDFMLYAIFLLAETGRPEVLKDLIYIITQEFEVLDHLFGDIIYDKAWMPLCRAGRQQVQALVEFCKGPNPDTSMVLVTQALVQIALLYPESREEAVEGLIEIANFCMTEAAENLSETNFVSNLVTDLEELLDPTLLPVIRALYDQGLVDKTYAGTYEEVKVRILEKSSAPLKVVLQDVFELCAELGVT